MGAVKTAMVAAAAVVCLVLGVCQPVFADTSPDPAAQSDEITLPEGAFSAMAGAVVWKADALAGTGQYSPPSWWPLREQTKIWCTYLSEGRCGDYHPYWALDIGAYLGQPIYASGAGKAAVYAGSPACGGDGQGVIVDHGNGVSSMYWHMSSIAVSNGQWVDQNTVIGYVGTSGNVDPCGAYHLHYEKRLNGQKVDPGPLKACFGQTLTRFPQQNGYNSWRGYPADVTYAHSDGTGCDSPTADGAFVGYLGETYRMVGGAPVVISSWDPFGGPQAITTLSASQWAGLAQYPADGSRIRSMPSGREYVIAGGAPLAISRLDAVPPATPVEMDDYALAHLGESAPLAHLRATPTDVFLYAYRSQLVYRVVGGHPFQLLSWDPYGGVQAVVAIDQNAIDSCDHLDCSPWGNFEGISGGDGSFVASGWAVDSESAASPTVRIVVDGVALSDASANLSRPDVDAAYHRGPGFGFSRVVRVGPGQHQVCLTVLNSGKGADVGLGCRSVTVNPTTFQPAVDRIAGADRFETAVSISAAGFPKTAPVVYVATGTGFPDALSAAPAAIKQGGPILLTMPDALPASVRAEIVRLQPKTIVVVGGSQAVSAAIFDDLQSIATTVRVSGADRFETSAAIADYAFPSATRAYVATGADFPDALSAGAAAGTASAPVILVDGRAAAFGAVTQATLTRLHPSRITVVGGASVMSDAIVTQLGTIASTTRLGGDSRFSTSQLVNADAFQHESRVFLATASGFPDALAGAALAGKLTSPLFVVPSYCVPRDSYSAMAALGASRVTLFGGASALDENVAGLLVCDW